MELQKPDLLYKLGWPRSLSFTPLFSTTGEKIRWKGPWVVLVCPGLQGNICSVVESPWAAAKSQLWCLEFLPSLFLWPGCSQGCFSQFFPLTLLCVFCSFLNIFSRKCHQLHWWAQMRDVVCSWQSQLGLAGSSPVWHGAALVSPHRDSCSPYCWHLDTDTQF